MKLKFLVCLILGGALTLCAAPPDVVSTVVAKPVVSTNEHMDHFELFESDRTGFHTLALDLPVPPPPTDGPSSIWCGDCHNWPWYVRWWCWQYCSDAQGSGSELVRVKGAKTVEVAKDKPGECVIVDGLMICFPPGPPDSK